MTRVIRKIHNMGSLEYYIEKAREHGACEDVLKILSNYSTIEEALVDEAAPYWCFWYVKYVIKDRWLEAEPIIVQDAWYAYQYAEWVLKGRWLEAEPTIMKDMQITYWYVRDVIQGCWPEAEPIIMKEKYWWKQYQEFLNTLEKE